MSPSPQDNPPDTTQLSLQPQDLTAVARNLSRDASDFTSWSAKVRQHLESDPTGGWKSAGFFQVPNAVTNQHHGAKSASALLRIVDEDMRILAQRTKKLAEDFGELDDLNSAGIDRIIAAIGRTDPPGNADLLQ